MLKVHGEFLCTESGEVRRDRFESFEFARMATLSFQQLFVQSFSHRQEKPSRDSARDQRSGLTGSNQLPQE